MVTPCWSSSADCDASSRTQSGTKPCSLADPTSLSRYAPGGHVGPTVTCSEGSHWHSTVLVGATTVGGGWRTPGSSADCQTSRPPMPW